jgi:pyruvate dehydrogenase E2 component (dihydrolipoamide acetyltransferase)
MPRPVTIPRLGWSMDEGVFAGWIKQDGDRVEPGEPLYRLESEKVTQDIESLDRGILCIPADGPREGDTVAVGAVIGFLLEPGEVLEVPAASGGPPPAEERLSKDGGGERGGVSPSVLVGRIANPSHSAGTGGLGPRRSGEGRCSPAPGPARRRHPVISPRARRVAAELGVDWSGLAGSGRTGRIRERDIRAAASLAAPPAPPAPVPGDNESDLISITPLRKTIAVRTLHSLHTTAPVTLHTSVDASNLVNLRRQFSAAKSREVPSVTAFLVKLTALALRLHPQLNSRWTDAGIVCSRAVHIGVAVDTEAGIVVPVLRDVPDLPLTQVASRLRELAESARRRTLSIADLQGATFTVTNLGGFGVDTFTPIINHPECAVLGVGRLVRQPVVGEKNRVVVRDRLSLSLTFDHRIVDGAPAARFLQELSRIIENPGPWLMS